MTTTTDVDWHLVQLKPNAAKIAERNLLRQGFEVFLPLIEETWRRGQKFVTAARPLFPGYAFVGDDRDNPQWRALRSTLGVSRLVSFGSAPAQVPEALVQDLRSRCDEEGSFVPERDLSVGDQVKVTQGAFAEFLAKVAEIGPEERVWILLDMLGREIKTPVDRRSLQRISVI